MSFDENLLRIDDYIDGTLTPTERRKFEEHLTGCRACREELALCRRLTRLARAASPVAVPGGLDAAIRHRLLDTRGYSPAGRLRILPLLGGALAAAALLLLVLRTAPVPAPATGSEARSFVASTAASRYVARDELARGPTRASPDLDQTLSDWLAQAANAGGDETPELLAEARETRLLGRVREALRSRDGKDRQWLSRSEDLLVQLENDPSSRFLGEEARLVAKARKR